MTPLALALLLPGPIKGRHLRRRRILWRLAPLLLGLTPAALCAQPIQATSYGPLTICIAGYAIDVGPDEAVTVDTPADQRRTMNLRSDRIASLVATVDAPDDSPRTRSTFVLPGLGTVLRDDYAARDYMRAGIEGESVGVHEDARRDYVLPARGGAPALHVSSDGFREGRGDRRLLQRFRARDASTACRDPSPDPDGQRAREVIAHSPVRNEGPAYLCAGELGFALLAGESARHGWPDPESGILDWTITGAGYRVRIVGTRDPRRAGAHPYGRLLSIGFRLVPGDRGPVLYPPAGYPLHYGDDGRVFLEVAGLEGGRLRDFVGRLEFFRPGARRCTDPSRPTGRAGQAARGA